MPEPRDPDLVQIIGRLDRDLGELQRQVDARWGRVPHVAADPATPPDGGEWIRSDTGNLHWRANGVTYPSLWVAVTGGVGFQNAWVDFGPTQQTVQFRKIGDKVSIRGACKNGTINTTVFTLPAGFRPPADLSYGSAGAGVFAQINITSAGVVSHVGASNASFWINCDFSTIA